MFRLTVVVSLCAALLCGSSSSLADQLHSGLAQRQSRVELKQIPLLVLEGTPYERGLVHGKGFKEQIQTLIKLWKLDHGRMHKTDPDRFITAFMDETEYRAAIQEWTPDILEEIRGLSDGAEVDFNTMFAFQFLDETWARGDLAQHHCSGLGFHKSNEEPAYVAQTMDLETFRDGYQLMLHIKPDDSDVEILALSNVGCIGWCGVNNYLNP